MISHITCSIKVGIAVESYTNMSLESRILLPHSQIGTYHKLGVIGELLAQ